MRGFRTLGFHDIPYYQRREKYRLDWPTGTKSPWVRSLPNLVSRRLCTDVNDRLCEVGERLISLAFFAESGIK
jgi:hypothetical protein